MLLAIPTEASVHVLLFSQQQTLLFYLYYKMVTLRILTAWLLKHGIGSTAVWPNCDNSYIASSASDVSALAVSLAARLYIYK